jgi:uncharacterized protein (TIGR02266 family)
MTNSERRRTGRVKLDVEVSYETESHFFTGLGGDLSQGGIFVATYRHVPVGSSVTMELTLPAGTVRATGTVAWHRDGWEEGEPGLGIVFDPFELETREAIEEFCRERPPLYYDVVEPLPATG